MKHEINDDLRKQVKIQIGWEPWKGILGWPKSPFGFSYKMF